MEILLRMCSITRVERTNIAHESQLISVAEAHRLVVFEC